MVNENLFMYVEKAYNESFVDTQILNIAECMIIVSY